MAEHTKAGWKFHDGDCAAQWRKDGMTIYEADNNLFGVSGVSSAHSLEWPTAVTVAEALAGGHANLRALEAAATHAARFRHPERWKAGWTMVPPRVAGGLTKWVFGSRVIWEHSDTLGMYSCDSECHPQATVPWDTAVTQWEERDAAESAAKQAAAREKEEREREFQEAAEHLARTADWTKRRVFETHDGSMVLRAEVWGGYAVYGPGFNWLATCVPYEGAGGEGRADGAEDHKSEAKVAAIKAMLKLAGKQP